MVSFKISFWNKFSVELEVKNIILAIHIPSHSEVVDVISLFVLIMGRIYCSFVSSVKQPRADNLMTLKKCKDMNKLFMRLFVLLIYCFHLL